MSNSVIFKLITLCCLGSYRFIGPHDLHLCSLKELTKRWMEIESEVRAQENPPEDILDSLRELWAIVVVFRMNILQLGRRNLCQLDHESLWTKIFMLIWNRGMKKQEAHTVKLRYQPRKFSSLGGTLDALEKRLIRAQSVLDGQLRLANQGDQGHRERAKMGSFCGASVPLGAVRLWLVYIGYALSLHQLDFR